ncbi:hypothetical protein B566_EDAN004356 [Ephemera danica]|nr:hypothetical protein B566_EDAN004356 [Ephemera danica]
MNRLQLIGLLVAICVAAVAFAYDVENVDEVASRDSYNEDDDNGSELSREKRQFAQTRPASGFGNNNGRFPQGRPFQSGGFGGVGTTQAGSGGFVRPMTLPIRVRRQLVSTLPATNIGRSYPIQNRPAGGQLRGTTGGSGGFSGSGGNFGGQTVPGQRGSNGGNQGRRSG